MNSSSWNINRFFNHINVNDDDIISKIIDIQNLQVEDSGIDINDEYEKMLSNGDCIIKKKLKNDDIFNRDILSKIDDTDPLPSNLRKILEKYNLNSYFKIGVKKKLDSFFHSFMSIIDSSFYFNQLSQRETIISTIKKKMILDLSEKNYLRKFNYSRKHWNAETFREEFENEHIITDKTINYFQNYFNINIIIYNFKVNDFWISVDESFDYNRQYIVIIKYTDNDYEPIACQSWTNLNVTKTEDKSFIDSIREVKKHLGLDVKPLIDVKNNDSKDESITDSSEEEEKEDDNEEIMIKDCKEGSKNYSSTFFNKYLLNELQIIAESLDIEKFKLVNNVPKNKIKRELIEDILNLQVTKEKLSQLRVILNEIKKSKI